nr:hypothetical protein [Pseudomonadota bacterium]
THRRRKRFYWARDDSVAICSEGILGSNIFNTLLIGGTTVVVHARIVPELGRTEFAFTAALPLLLMLADPISGAVLFGDR